MHLISLINYCITHTFANVTPIPEKSCFLRPSDMSMHHTRYDVLMLNAAREREHVSHNRLEEIQVRTHHCDISKRPQLWFLPQAQS